MNFPFHRPIISRPASVELLSYPERDRISEGVHIHTPVSGAEGIGMTTWVRLTFGRLVSFPFAFCGRGMPPTSFGP